MQFCLSIRSLPKILILLNKHIELTTKLFELNNEDQINAIRAGQIDIGFVRSVPKSMDLSSNIVFDESFSLVLPANSPFAQHDNLSLRKLNNLPFISLNYNCAPSLIDSIIKICHDNGLIPKITHETSQINSIIRLVESGLGFSIVPTSVKSAYNLKVKFIEIPSKERARMYLLCTKRKSPLLNNAINLINDHFSVLD